MKITEAENPQRRFNLNVSERELQLIEDALGEYDFSETNDEVDELHCNLEEFMGEYAVEIL